MPGDAHIFTTDILLTFYTTPMAQDHGLCRKKETSNGPVHGPPLQARVAAANGTVLQLANCWPCLKQTAGPAKR